jgi:hypothetical protein
LLLTHFSHVLPLSVLADPQTVQEALKALDTVGIEAPISLHPEIESFCREGEPGSLQALKRWFWYEEV